MKNTINEQSIIKPVFAFAYKIYNAIKIYGKRILIVTSLLCASFSAYSQCNLDLVIVFDRTGSMFQGNRFPIEKSNAIQLINSRQFGEYGTKAGLIYFGGNQFIYDYAQTAINLTASDTSVINEINALNVAPVSGSNISTGLSLAYPMLLNYRRPNSQLAVVLFTNGQESVNTFQDVLNAKTQLENLGAVIYVFPSEPIANVDISEMMQIATTIPGVQTCFMDTSDMEGFISMLNTQYPLVTNASTPVISAFPNPYCAGDSVTLSITSGDLNDATHWQWYKDSCGANPIDTGTSIKVLPGNSSIYYLRGEGTCIANNNCASINIYEKQTFAWYADNDGDGYGNASDAIFNCDSVFEGRVLNDVDCNDANALLNPGNHEICNGIDDDCDYIVDEHFSKEWLAWFPFNSNADEKSGNGYNGTVNNAALARGVDDNPDRSYFFNGDSSMISFPHAPFHKNAFTYSALFYLSSSVFLSGRVYTIMSIGGTTADQRLVIANDPANGKVGVGFESKSISLVNKFCYSGSLPTHHAWHHIAATRDNSMLKVYLDGVLVCSTTTGTAASYSGNPLYATIGAHGAVDNQVFRGKLDEVMIHNGVLPDAEILLLRDNMSLGVAGDETCNGIDDDCDGLIDEGLTTIYYQDLDGDGHGNHNHDSTACTQPENYVTTDDDCNDTNAFIYEPISYFVDADYDGYGSTIKSLVCELTAPQGYSYDSTDCNDNNTGIHPGAVELYNNRDDDCDGYIEKKILTAEYFFNSDPGFGNGIPLSILHDTIINFTGTISLNGLSPGFNVMLIRTKDTYNKWSHAEKRVFYIFSPAFVSSSVIAAEYFFDTDPGLGNATSITITQGTGVNYAGIISVTGLPEGFHNIVIRTKDDNNKWSLSEKRLFYIFSPTAASSSIVAAEYFFDTDPGLGNATSVTTTPNNAVNYSAVIAVGNLPEGFHSMTIRTKDNNGKWSLAEKRLFYVVITSADATEIIAAEYFLDTDPGLGNGINIPLSPASTVTFCGAIALPVLPTGNHQLIIRTKDNRSKWSLLEKRSITVTSSSLVNITPSDTVIICSGNAVQLHANVTGGVYSYQWYRNCEVIAGATNATYAASSAGTYTVVISNAGTNQSAPTVFATAQNGTTWYVDADNDGYGIAANPVIDCQQPSGYVLNHLDCNDANSNIYPNALELCNGYDDNCDSVIDEGCIIVLNLRAYMEGFYLGNDTIQQALFNSGVSTNHVIADSVTIELHDPNNTGIILASVAAVIDVNGYVEVNLPSLFIGSTVYIVFKHRNSMEVWSKVPVTIGSNTTYDFTH